MYGDKYYAQSDSEEEQDGGAKQKQLNMRLMNDKEISEEGEQQQEDSAMEDQYERELAKSLKKQVKEKQ